MNKKGYYVNVYANKNKRESDYLKIRCEGFETIIPKLYVEEKNLSVKDGNMFISKELFEDWFKEAIQEKEEASRKRKAIFDSFYPHIPLFWNNRTMIRTEPRYYSVRPPQHFMGLAYMGASFITLGELLQIWECEEALIFKCTCGGKSVCFQFTGSPLSGSQGDACTICLECSKVDMKGGKTTRLWDKIQARKKYRPMEPVAVNCATYEELIGACD